MRDEERYSSSRPLKEFHGNEDDYPDWETDFETWSVRRGYDRHLEMEDPRERDRVWASYTVSRNDDPLGPIGARIYRESPDRRAQGFACLSWRVLRGQRARARPSPGST